MKTLRQIAHALLRPLSANGAFMVTMYVLGVLCAWLTLPHQRGAHLYEHLYTELFLDLYLACVVLMLLPQGLRKWVRRVLYVVLYAVAIVDVYVFWKFGSTLTPSILMLVGETDAREAGEFIHSYLSPEVIFSPVGWILLLMIVHAALAIFPSLGKRLVSLLKSKTQLRPSPQARTICGGLVGVLLIVAACTSFNNKVGMTQLMTADNIGTVEHLLTKKDCGQMYLPIYRLAFSLNSNRLADKQVDQCIAAAKRVKVDSCSYRSPLIVLIIGESYGKQHSQQYGYFLKTTPRQVAREESGLLTKFTDVVSCWNLTSFVFKNVLSMHVIGQPGEWCDYPLFPEVFRKAGYQVSFFTNQFLPKAKEAVYDFSGGFFLNNPTLSKAQFDVRNTRLHRFDEGLLKDYDSHQPGPDHQLVIFHLIGQHVNYRTRCPDNQRVFGPEAYDERRPELSTKKKRLIADYDNAVHYNDSVVDAIISRFEDKDAIVIYMPDHGEECYEPGRDFICRLHSADIDWPLAHYEFEIPFWIWCSHPYAAKHPEVFKAIKDAKDKRFMTDALPHMLVWLAGISTPDYHAEYNLLSPQYNEKRPRILKNSVDYDKLRK